MSEQEETQIDGGYSGLLHLQSHFKDLKPAQQKVAQYILHNVEDVIYTSITRLSEKTDVSEATIVKLCQQLGYSGYQDFKISLARESHQQSTESKIYGEIEPRDSLATVKNKMFQKYEDVFADTKGLLSEEKLAKIIAKINKSRRLFFFGYGASSLVARDAALKFSRINLQATAVANVHDQKMLAANMTAEDLVFAISNSGRTREILEVVGVLKKNNCPVVGITSQAGSPLGERVDYLLLNSSQETTFRGSAMASRLAQLVVVDMIFLGTALDNYEETNLALKRTREAVRSSKV